MSTLPSNNSYDAATATLQYQRDSIVEEATLSAELEETRIQQLKLDNKFVVVDNREFKRQTKELAIKEVKAPAQSLDRNKLREYTNLYIDTFEKECKRILHDHNIPFEEIDTEKQRKLRDLALQDKKKYEATPLSDSDLEILAALRVAEAEEWSAREAWDHLAELKLSIASFTKYYKRTQEVVYWPDSQEGFRSSAQH